VLHVSPIPKVCWGLQEATLTLRDDNGCNDMRARASLRLGDLESKSNPWGCLPAQLLHRHCLCECGEAEFEIRVGLYISSCGELSYQMSTGSIFPRLLFNRMSQCLERLVFLHAFRLTTPFNCIFSGFYGNYCFHKSPLLVPILNHIYPVHTTPSSLRLNIIHLCMSWQHSSRQVAKGFRKKLPGVK
jgi:hypothetical protein